MSQEFAASSERRSFLTRFNAGAAAVAAMVLGGRAVVQVKSGAPAKWEPARHDQDNWMDELPGKHRMAFDTTSGQALGDALLFATNFITANRNDYGLASSDLGLIIVLRHLSTGYAYNDAMWTKYPQLATVSEVSTPTKTNPRNTGGMSMDSLSKQGLQFAVCAMATRRIAGQLAKAAGAETDAVNTELVANLVAGARMVPAGIVAVNRAQERGYSLVKV